jgi:hypothetical protein
LPKGEVEEGLDKANPPLSEAEREDERQQIEFGRRHGYLFAVQPSDLAAPIDFDPIHSHVGGYSRVGGRFITVLEPERSYALQFLVAPVMNERGRVAFAITLSGFGRMYFGSEVAQIGARLLEACRRVTSFIAGKQAAASY